MREHADPTPPVVDALRGFFALPVNTALFGGVVRVVAEDHPDPAGDAPWSLLDDPPLLIVHDDGGPTQWPVLRRPTVRVTAYARGKPLAKRVAARADGHLHDNVPAGLAYLSRNGSGYVMARDKDTGADMASFTVTATVATIETV